MSTSAANAQATPNLSVVIPVHNEEENIHALYRVLTAVLERLCEADQLLKNGYEIILVDDGSSDHSWQLISDLHKSDHRVRGLRLSRCFGHHAALTAGLDSAEGAAVILMDGDLQDPPEEIPKLYDRFKQGADLVYGIRTNRQDPVLKRMNSFLFWWTINKISGIPMPINQTMLRIMSRPVVDAIVAMREHARFVHGMMAWTGFEVATVEIAHQPRLKGESKYNFLKQLKLAVYAITSFSVKPLRAAVVLGFAASGVSCLVGIYLLVGKFLHNYAVLGWASTIVAIFFIGGIQLSVLGIIGEYIGKIYQETQRRPLYITRERLGGE